MTRYKILFISIIFILSIADVCPQKYYCGGGRVVIYEHDIFGHSYDSENTIREVVLRKGDFLEYGPYRVYFKELYYDDHTNGYYTNVNVQLYFSRKRDKKGFSYFIGNNKYWDYKLFDSMFITIKELHPLGGDSFEIVLAFLRK